MFGNDDNNFHKRCANFDYFFRDFYFVSQLFVKMMGKNNNLSTNFFSFMTFLDFDRIKIEFAIDNFHFWAGMCGDDGDNFHK